MSVDPQTQTSQAGLSATESVPIVAVQPGQKPANCIVFEDLEIPLGLTSLSEFRKWAVSESFPKRGRIDYLAGRIEVDMSPENVFSHGALKTEIGTAINMRVKRQRLGNVFIDRTRLSTTVADLSAEPDVLFVSKDAIAARRVTLVPYVDDPEEFIEFEGAADLVVEIVSKSSVGKDTVRLPKLYWQAGVREFWLADARKGTVRFQIHYPGQNGYEPATLDADGFQRSQVLGCDYRLERGRDENGHWEYSLVEREAAQ